ncbi:Mitochondrial assembly of ribosomal large subunit protein 1 [Frankliniella fusca]|uniref:Mitochondrial assembly of ribosomal large subunit protein 1 n=1 Tax=Frankliniella fusca TaxID=407009 RepID=A0AAE1LJ23_9NEOP|nr:Mitochondrial assembly of ribosomal large subunit protein 1 [Frankliniella fusca]
MFARSTIIGLLSNSRKIIATNEQFLTSKLMLPNVVHGVDKLDRVLSRYNSDDHSKNWKSLQSEILPKEENTPLEDESLEVFDLEKERTKLQQAADLSSKYEVFKDEDAQIILDVEEERIFSRSNAVTQPVQEEFDGISLTRGIHGVFDITDLVTALKNQSAEEIAVIELPKDVGYADYMVIVSGKSNRHLKALADHVRKLFKRKMHPNDKIPAIEGKRTKSNDWLALDLGNIILHIFSKETREVYDLESLWILGPEFDPHLNEIEDPLDAIINKHSSFLSDLEPADKNS